MIPEFPLAPIKAASANANAVSLMFSCGLTVLTMLCIVDAKLVPVSASGTG